MRKVSKNKTATVYARAWFEASKDLQTEDTVFEEVKILLTSISENPSLWGKIYSPIADRKAVENVIREVAGKSKISDVSTNALCQIAQNGKISLIRFILQGFADFYYKDKGIIMVEVDTAVKLTVAQDKKLKQALEKKLNKKVETVYNLKPEILGGLAIRFGSFLFDDTLLNKLRRIKQIMAAK